MRKWHVVHRPRLRHIRLFKLRHFPQCLTLSIFSLGDAQPMNSQIEFLFYFGSFFKIINQLIIMHGRITRQEAPWSLDSGKRLFRKIKTLAHYCGEKLRFISLASRYLTLETFDFHNLSCDESTSQKGYFSLP